MNGSKLRHRTGSEGPSHDPYHYDEYTLERASGAVTTLHVGLSTWLRHNSFKIIEDNETALFAKWSELTGLRNMFDVSRIQRRQVELPYRRHSKNCSNRYLTCVSGYPGETITVCSKCKAVLDVDFDRSAVE